MSMNNPKRDGMINMQGQFVQKIKSRQDASAETTEAPLVTVRPPMGTAALVCCGGAVDETKTSVLLLEVVG